MHRFIKILVASATLSSVAATDAFAHAFLDHAVPGVGMTVSGSPHELRLYFTQGVVTAFSGVQVASDTGAPVPAGKPVNDPSNQSGLDRPAWTCAQARHLYGDLACGLGRYPYNLWLVQIYSLLIWLDAFAFAAGLTTQSARQVRPCHSARTSPTGS